MRRHDREITDRGEMIDILAGGSVCRLAFNDTDYPYIVPLNYGLDIKDDSVTLYFHSAKVGKKIEMIRRNRKASFEVDCGHTLVLEHSTGNCTMNYESVIGHGVIEFVPDNEKLDALKILMKHYRHEDFPFNEDIVPQTEVFRLKVSDMTGKRRQEKVKE